MKTEKLKIKYIQGKDLRYLEGNPRKVINPDGVDRLKKLIDEHGFQNPLQVYLEEDGQYSILCGNHRFKAGQEMGISSFPCIEYKGDRSSAIARAISDNKSSEWTEWDIPLLEEMYTDLKAENFDLGLTGFTPEEFESLFDSSSNSKKMGSLSDRFLVPPFTVFNARDGWWQDRKRFWRDLGIESELGREGCAPGGSPLPSSSMEKKGGKFVRGDATGKAVDPPAKRKKLKLMARPVIRKTEGFLIVRDDLLNGGTKRRFLQPYIKESDKSEFVYASPAYGYAQIALAYAAKSAGKKATIFVAKRNELHPRTAEAKKAGAAIMEVPNGYLKVVQKRARDYAKETDSDLVPFGADLPQTLEIIKATAEALKINPKEVWSVAGSGTLTRGLQMAWPQAKFHAVIVGKADADIGRAKRWEAPEKFEADAQIPPPFPSCGNYDAKAWRFMQDHASPGALFWNVA